MRSDFYGLPWAAQQAIRRGERDAGIARHHAQTKEELQAKVDELEKALAEANARLSAEPEAVTLREALAEAVATRSEPTMDASWSAGWNAAMDFVTDKTSAALTNVSSRVMK